MSDAQELSADEKANVARFGIHDSGIRVKVWCVNWSHLDAPHAAVFVEKDGDLSRGSYYASWAQAMLHADRLAKAIRATAAYQASISSRLLNSEGLATPFPGVSDAAS